MEFTRQESDGTLAISGELDIRVAEHLLTSLRDVYQASDALVVDLSRVQKCDVTTLQIFYSARKTANANGKSLEFKNLPAAVEDVSQMLGLPVNDWATLSAASEAERTPAPCGTNEGTSHGV